MMHVGDTWDESAELADQVTARPTRRITRSGLYNETPTYHLNAAFTADSKSIVFATAREGASAIIRADLATGQMTVVAVSDGIGSGSPFGSDESLSPHVAGTLGGGFTGNHLCVVQPTNWAVACIGRSLRAYHLQTFEQRILIADIGRQYRMGNPIGSIDGKSVLVTRSPVHPDYANGLDRTTRRYFDAVTADLGGMRTTYLQVSLADGSTTEPFREELAGSNHVQPCPADPELWLIDRDFPPKYAHGGDDGKTSRAWLLDTRTRKLTEIRPRHPNRFQIHTNWNHDGTRIYYHGWSFVKDGDHYIGVADRNGNIVWEQSYPRFFYGHVSAHTTRHAIVTDGLITPDLVTAIHYQDLDRNGLARIEVLARHGTLLDGLRGQYTHAHPHLSPDGRWLSYNRGELGRTDVCIVQI